MATSERKADILGIESSCDETAAAVVRSGSEILSNIVFSQFATHRPYGGVVPELASREHLRALVPVVRKALSDAGHSYGSIDAIAVTQGPGLAGALLVGITYAKALAFALQKPLVAVNHLEGHIHAVLLEEKRKGNNQIQFPILSLVVSGGHTHLFLSEEKRGGSAWAYQAIGRTRDDAAGEAFDKVAKLLALGYPGGPAIDALARFGDPKAVKFAPAQIKNKVAGKKLLSAKTSALHGGKKSLPEPGLAATPVIDFSFSGIKTAVLRYVELHNMYPGIEKRRNALREIEKPATEDVVKMCDQQTLDLAASFQNAIVGDLVGKTLRAARETNAATLFITGGVAANSELRSSFEAPAAQQGVAVYFPTRRLSTDNAAMIAAAAYPKFINHHFAEATFSAEPALALR